MDTESQRFRRCASRIGLDCAPRRDTSTSSINTGANTPALALTKPMAHGWQTAIHPADLPDLLERWQSILTSGEPGKMEVRLRRFDGEYRWFGFRVRPLADASGQIVKWCGMGTDIEGRRLSEEARAHAR